MSPLDAARQFADHEPRDHHDVGGYGFCPLCDESEGHTADCPWLSMARIVAALEAAERIMDRMCDSEPSEPTDCPLHHEGINEICQKPVGEHADDCPWQALVAALKEPT